MGGTILARSSCQNAVLGALTTLGLSWHATRQYLREWLHDGADRVAAFSHKDADWGFTYPYQVRVARYLLAVASLWVLAHSTRVEEAHLRGLAPGPILSSGPSTRAWSPGVNPRRSPWSPPCTSC